MPHGASTGASNLVVAMGGRRFSGLLPQFLDYCRYDRRFSPQSVEAYRYKILKGISVMGDLDVTELTQLHVLELKRGLFQRGLSEPGVRNVIFAMRSLLTYCREVLGLETIEPTSIRAPREPRRDVLFLTKDEVERFLQAIPLNEPTGLKYRTLCEVLLGTAMRIGEALSLDRGQINFERREAKIVGKGNKERIAFFTERSLEWGRRYLETRWDDHPALFVVGYRRKFRRMEPGGQISVAFRRFAVLAGIDKKITPHIFRHTAATHMVFNGCPIAHVKEILGHERIDTTCRYYLGLDRKEAKAAHERFLSF